MLHIKINRIKKYSNMVAIILPADPLPHLTLGSKGQIHGHVAYQRKWYHEI